MSIKFIYIIVLCISAFSCTYDEDDNGYLKSVSGKVFLIKDTGDSLLSGIAVYLNDLVDFSNESGEYNFSNVNPGKYTLKIIDSNYVKWDTVISVDSDINLDIYLKKLYDFFPLYIGNNWNYNFHEYDPISIGQFYDIKGIVNWKIIDLNVLSDSSRTYQVVEILNGVRVDYKPPLYLDTLSVTVIKNDTSYFTVTESSIRDPLKLNTWFGQIEVMRYSDSEFERIHFSVSVNLNPYYCDITLKKNVGMYSWGIHSSSSMFAVYTQYRLIE